MRARLAMIVAILVTACAGEPLELVTPAIHTEPTAVAFPDVAAGAVARAPVRIVNDSDIPLHLALSASNGFAVDTGEIALAAHGKWVVTVTFAPTLPGDWSGSLAVSSTGTDARVALSGHAGPAVSCPPPADPCHEGFFDAAAAACAVRGKLEGAACADGCTSDGQCVAGQCTGPSLSCDDGDPDTEDRCVGGSCRHGRPGAAP